MSGFAIRRFILQNFTAVATFSPLPPLARAARADFLGSTTGGSVGGWGVSFMQRMLTGAPAHGVGSHAHFGLLTEDEMRWIREQRAEEALHQRIVLSTRPTRSLLRGLAGGALNVALGCLVSPLVFLIVSLERLRLMGSPAGLLVGPAYGLLWSGVFLSTAWVAAAQQVLYSVYYACIATPLYYGVSRRASAGSGAVAWQWSCLACRFVAPRGVEGASDPWLSSFPPDATIHERGLHRLLQRKRHGAAEHGDAKAASGTSNTVDYYKVLGVQSRASPQEIKAAYKERVLRMHPDKNKSPQAPAQFEQVVKAYKVLSNPAKRKKYDLGGNEGVEDVGAKKREGVRALFGGEALNRLSGDVFLGSFMQRVIDGADYMAEELAVLRARMYERCRDELLGHYLKGYVLSNENSAPSVQAQVEDIHRDQANKANNAWCSSTTVKLRKASSTGLAKEVLLTLGHEYLRVLQYFDAEARDGVTGFAAVALPQLVWQRVVLYATQLVPERSRSFMQKARYAIRVRSSTFKSSEAMVDLAWYLAVAELQRTAREVAFAILYDPTLSFHEAMRRRNALEALAKLCVQSGQVYTGANKATMDALMNSLRAYQQEKHRADD